MKLRAICFMPGILVTIGGKHVPISNWDVEKHEKDIACEEKNNGDVWLRVKEGPLNNIVRVVSKQAVAYRTYDVEDKK